MSFHRKDHLVCGGFLSKQGVLGVELNGIIADMDNVRHCDSKPLLLFNGNKGLGMRNFLKNGHFT